jgi:signal transduction histidine kinase
MPPPTIEELRKVVALSELPDEHLQWILDRSEYHEYEDGALLLKTGDTADHMWMIIEGKGSFYMDMNGKLVYYFTFENDTLTGGVSGMLPYSRMKTSPGYSYAIGKVRLLMLHRKYFHELEQLNPELIKKLIAYMTDRARVFATVQLQQEKVSALGKLSAGIAHELNNPASAINRISAELTKRLKLNYEHTEKLLFQQINPGQIQKINALVEAKEKAAQNKLTTMQQMAKEDEINDWLKIKRFEDNGQAGESFSEAGFGIEDFENILSDVGDDAFTTVLGWLENIIISKRMLKDLDDASCRISNLVGAIKSHVHMDLTNDLQPTKINKDIDNTLTLLGYKIREKNISVKKKYAENMPEVLAYVGELNQVWTNIIDNAIFAMGEQGELTIETSCDNNNAKVCITDNGSGIPKEIASRIFDPFFTTKKVGQGTGIGLDLVQRIIKRHNGEIKVNSVPGRTEFSICIPVSQNQPLEQ